MLKTRPALMNASFGSGESSAPSSKLSPVLISLAARTTLSPVIMLAVPRWSPAPHFDGQRSASGGIRQPCAGSVEAVWAWSAVVSSPSAIARVIAVFIINYSSVGAGLARPEPQAQSGGRHGERQVLARLAALARDHAFDLEAAEEHGDRHLDFLHGEVAAGTQARAGAEGHRHALGRARRPAGALAREPACGVERLRVGEVALVGRRGTH